MNNERARTFPTFSKISIGEENVDAHRRRTMKCFLHADSKYFVRQNRRLISQNSKVGNVANSLEK